MASTYFYTYTSIALVLLSSCSDTRINPNNVLINASASDASDASNVNTPDTSVDSEDSLVDNGDSSCVESENIDPRFYWILVEASEHLDMNTYIMLDSIHLETCENNIIYPVMSDFGISSTDEYTRRTNSERTEFLSGEPDLMCSEGDYVKMSNSGTYFIYEIDFLMGNGDSIVIHLSDCDPGLIDFSEIEISLTDSYANDRLRLIHLGEGKFGLDYRSMRK